MALDDHGIAKLQNIIRNSFRVRKNQEPLYVDLGNNLERIAAPQHQVIFGRRGSGKSCLMVHYLRSAKKHPILPIYVLADEYKRLTYPDILIRLILQIMEEVASEQPFLKRLVNKRSLLSKSMQELRSLLDMAGEADVVEDRMSRSAKATQAELKAEGIGRAGAKMTAEASAARTSSFKEHKLELLERHLHDHKSAILTAIQETLFKRACVLLDDFYLIPRHWQADVIDYLHRLLRDSDIYLKVATIRHRTTLSRNHPQTIGVELSQDVEELNLDRTFEDVEATQNYLSNMLGWMAVETGLPDVINTHFNPEAVLALTLASGGVPRDFLNIFVNAVDVSLNAGSNKWLTPKFIWKGAGRLTYQTKLRNLREDADESTARLERLFVDLLQFCLSEKRRTAFLISQEEAQRFGREHNLIQQLMDMRLIHVIESDTSAASRRSGRYEAYTLDFSLFMEPRRRKIDIVEFWEKTESRSKKGVREAPVYSLERAGKAFDGTVTIAPETFLEQVPEEKKAGLTPKTPKQISLFDEV